MRLHTTLPASAAGGAGEGVGEEPEAEVGPASREAAGSAAWLSSMQGLMRLLISSAWGGEGAGVEPGGLSITCCREREDPDPHAPYLPVGEANEETNTFIQKKGSCSVGQELPHLG